MTTDSASHAQQLAKLESALYGALDWLVDLVFPPRCGNCGRVDHRFCPACLAELQSLPLRLIDRSVAALNGVLATGPHLGVLAEAVKSFKYEDALELCAPLAARLAACLDRLPEPVDAIVPAPLHAERELERGYNQSGVLGGHLAASTGLAFEPAWLVRIRQTSQQAHLEAAQRRHNVRGAFRARDNVAGKSILLVDDVVTTGSTLAECASALRARKARAVYALVLSSS